MKKIFISGNLFSWNYGTMAMALSIIEQFSKEKYHYLKASVDLDNDKKSFAKEINRKELTIFGFNKHFLPMQIASPLLLFYCLRYLKTVSVVLETPGEIPNDISFYSQLFRFLAAKIFGKKFVIYGCSLGPFKTFPTIFLARWMYAKVDALLVRESVTKHYLQQIGVKNAILTSDHTFLLAPEKSDQLAKLKKRINHFVGITVKHKYFYDCRNYKMAITDLIRYITNDLGVAVVLIPHGKEDILPSKIIYNKGKDNNGKDCQVYLLEGDYSPRELKWLISQADFFVGSRIHACIAALSSSVPTIIFIPFFDHRSLGFMSEFGLREVVVDPYSQQSLLQKFKQYYTRRTELRNKIISKLPELKKRARLNAKIVNSLLKTG